MSLNDFIRQHLAESHSRLDNELARETIVSERLRARILFLIFALGLKVVVVMPLLFQDEYLRIFHKPGLRYWMMALLGFSTFYEFMVFRVTGRLLARNWRIPDLPRYGNALVEITIPTTGLYLLSQVFVPVHALLTPLSLVYFLLIILSTLRLDFWLCVFTGFVAAVEYVLLSLLMIERSQMLTAHSIVLEPALYYGKGTVMLASGIAAGFVAHQIKKRFLRTFALIEERNQIVNLFGQQVSQPIVDEMIANKYRIESRRQFVCVMFLDIRNFTPFAEARPPEEVVTYLNTLFGAMIEIVSGHGGIINQFLGDGFMATFGAPVSQGNEAQHAVAAARNIISRVKHLEHTGAIPPTRVGIGLHCGEAVTGNVGSKLRQQYSITGEVVILASRIEQLNKSYDSQLLVSHDVLSQLNGEASGADLLGPVNVKGHKEPLVIYRMG
jgi:adenylate cyclase